jgi:hypothetical protein
MGSRRVSAFAILTLIPNFHYLQTLPKNIHKPVQQSPLGINQPCQYLWSSYPDDETSIPHPLSLVDASPRIAVLVVDLQVIRPSRRPSTIAVTAPPFFSNDELQSLKAPHLRFSSTAHKWIEHDGS